MTRNAKKLEVDASTIVLALGYGSCLLVLLGWMATLIL